MAASAPLLAPSTVCAQAWQAQAGVSSQLAWSSDPQFGLGNGREDLILDIRPYITIHREGPRFQASGTAALNAITTVNGTEERRVLPEADLNARLEALERFLYVEAGLRALRISEDPFGARPGPATHFNTMTSVQARLSPSIESTISPNMRYRLRSDNTTTRETGADSESAIPLAEGYFGRHAAFLEHDPKPLGWRIEAERSETRYRGDTQQPLTLDLARLSVDYAVGANVTAGVRIGRERTSVLPDGDQDRNIVGAQASWRPSARTTLSAFHEKRFFGSSWNLGFDHRRPRFAWNIVLSRSLATAMQALFELPPTNNVEALLDAMFITRFPDPAERARAVDDFIARQGLPTQTLRPIDLHTRRLSLVTLRSATVAMTGIRNTVTLTAFALHTEDAEQAGSLATGSSVGNNKQHGASAALTHRLSPTTALTVSSEWSRIRATNAADLSIQRSATVRLNRQASPWTVAFVGARYRELDSNVAADGEEGVLFVGFDHKF
ncbi:TIGR03016 family PEP-CTERM system-associated outer membrane protein [Piscinibacter sp.]|uniref:TIGR03016 family PEP-CTERM system-associated outer membrane protein n=1 Tax=Piscinibacter sp. TaxID=1903157 RepID=UPI002C032585|nr:TIGR03016 family PEP-CTERM system-associated outer membrane protein [Albitalea sp.]HUG25784.1 TIGR03016 family PEP-CTERM system-associated outer membrane protein [Albitalea sp.]